MVPENCYVNRRELEPFRLGIRIDYVLYKVRPLPPKCPHPLASLCWPLALSSSCTERPDGWRTEARNGFSAKRPSNTFLSGPYFPRQFLGSTSPVRLSELLLATTLTAAALCLTMRP